MDDFAQRLRPGQAKLLKTVEEMKGQLAGFEARISDIEKRLSEISEKLKKKYIL